MKIWHLAREKVEVKQEGRRKHKIGAALLPEMRQKHEGSKLAVRSHLQVS